MSISSSLPKDVVLHCPVCLRERGEMIYYAPPQKHCVVCQCESLEPLERAGYTQVSYGIDEILRDPAASFWLKAALRSALARDPVEAANDAEVLTVLLDKRSRTTLTES